MGLVLGGENGGRTHRHLALRYAHSSAAQGTSLLPQRFRSLAILRVDGAGSGEWKKLTLADVYVQEPDGQRVFDIQIQSVITKEEALRARYYQGMLDLDNLLKGSDYIELPKTYIIFLCMKDPFHLNLPIYEPHSYIDLNKRLYKKAGSNGRRTENYRDGIFCVVLWAHYIPPNHRILPTHCHCH